MKKVVLILVIIGVFNWGVIGILGIDLIGSIFGGIYEMVSRIIYFIVGLVGLYLILSLMFDDRE